MQQMRVSRLDYEHREVETPAQNARVVLLRNANADLERLYRQKRAMEQLPKTVTHHLAFVRLDVYSLAESLAANPVPEILPPVFERLARIWEQETANLSSQALAMQHPAYKAVIKLGDQVVPILLNRLASEPEHWFYALQLITGASPVVPSARGNISAMAECWIAWGRDNGLI